MALMRDDGIRPIVPLWRNDTGNNGLHDSVQAAFQLEGGTVVAGCCHQLTASPPNPIALESILIVR